MEYAISFENILESQKILNSLGYIRCTPMLRCSQIDELLSKKLGRNLEIHFKAENLQKTGSFKIRGSSFAVHKLHEERGSTFELVTHSSGIYSNSL